MNFSKTVWMRNPSTGMECEIAIQRATLRAGYVVRVHTADGRGPDAAGIEARWGTCRNYYRAKFSAAYVAFKAIHRAQGRAGFVTTRGEMRSY